MSFSSIAHVVTSNPNITQVSLFAAVFVSLWMTEWLVTARPALTKLKHTSLNVLYMSAVLPIQLLMMLLCVAVANWTVRNQWGLIHFLPDADSPWIKYGLMFFVLDFLDYVYHVIAHRFAPLWRLHSLHHTDRAVDVSTTFREHPGETLVRTCFLTLWVFLCGASLEILVLRQTFETFANVSQHTTFRLPAGPGRVLGWLFVTPNLHHTHHHFRRPGTDCNYGDVLSIWDRLFGTYVDLAHEDTVFGLDSRLHEDPDETLLRLLNFGVSSRPVRFARRIYGSMRVAAAGRILALNRSNRTGQIAIVHDMRFADPGAQAIAADA